MIQVIEPLEDNIVSFKIHHSISRDDITKAVSLMENKLENFEKVKMLTVIKDTVSYTPEAFISDFKATIKHFDDFEKVAVVSDKRWLEKLTGMTDFFLKADVEYFEAKKLDQAKKWIKE